MSVSGRGLFILIGHRADACVGQTGGYYGSTGK